MQWQCIVPDAFEPYRTLFPYWGVRDAIYWITKVLMWTYAHWAQVRAFHFESLEATMSKTAELIAVVIGICIKIAVGMYMVSAILASWFDWKLLLPNNNSNQIYGAHSCIDIRKCCPAVEQLTPINNYGISLFWNYGLSRPGKSQANLNCLPPLQTLCTHLSAYLNTLTKQLIGHPKPL